jgi:hypothetical protein
LRNIASLNEVLVHKPWILNAAFISVTIKFYTNHRYSNT